MSEYIYDTSRVETQPEQGFTGETVVRCRDCKHYVEHQGYATCGYFDSDYAEVDPDGFCAWGERRQA